VRAAAFVRLTGGAGPELGEDQIDHRRLGDEGDDAQRDAAASVLEKQRVEMIKKLPLAAEAPGR